VFFSTLWHVVATLHAVKYFLSLFLFLILMPTQVSADALLGIYYGNQGWDMQSVRDIEAWQGKKHAVVKVFTDWSPANKRNLFEKQLPAVWGHGSVPIINWELYTDVDTPPDILSRVVQGKYKKYLDSWVRNLKRFLAGKDHVYGTTDDRRVYLQFAHEMNSDWYLWSGKPEQYVQAWRYVYQQFKNQGLDHNHVQWIWCVNNTDKSDAKAEAYYPGTDYVDWVGINGYNWGEQGNAHHWESVATVFDVMRQRMAVFKKPLVISEVGSSSKVKGGRSLVRKAAWIQDLFSYVQQHDIRMVMWFNEDKDVDWAIFSGKRGTAKYQGKYYYTAYREAVASSKLLSPDEESGRLLSDAYFHGVVQQSVETVNVDVIAKQYASIVRTQPLKKAFIMPKPDHDPYVQVKLHQKMKWHGGYCATVELISHAQINHWQMELALTGELIGVWAAQYKAKKPFRVLLWPYEWNALLRKGERIKFDFCARGQLKNVVVSHLKSRTFAWKTYYELPPLQIRQKFNSIWKGGYCVEFRLKNISDQTVTWKGLQLRLPDSRLTSHWNGKFFANHQYLNIQSETWNHSIKPKEKKKLGFCADGKNQILLDKVLIH